MPTSRVISPKVDAFLEFLKPRHRDRTKWPPELSRYRTADLGIGNSENVQHWLRRVIQDYCNDRPESACLADNIAVFAECHWKKNQLIYANIQIAASEAPMENILLEAMQPIEYFRLDLDEGSLGLPFHHPFPHLHFSPPNQIRIPFHPGSNGNVVADFVEILFQNFAYNQWQNWAEQVWNEHWIKNESNPDDNPWNRIMAAFRDGNLAVLRANHGQHLDQLKKLLQNRKDEFFPHFLKMSDWQLLAYPARAISQSL